MPAARRSGPALRSPLVLASPLSSWFPDATACARFRRRALGRAPLVLTARDRAWRSVAPDFTGALAIAASGLPFQIVAGETYDRRGDPRRLARAVATGATVFMPQIHQVLPRLARLMVALRVVLLPSVREGCSFLFAVEGQGRPGMRLHHDGDVHGFWLQLEGRRTVTIGPPVAAGTPSTLDPRRAAGGARAGWRTLDLDPGSLFYLPPRTPHAVVCRARSLALSLTWSRARRPRTTARRARGAEFAVWDVASGYVDRIPPVSRTRLWTQVPTRVGGDRRRDGRFQLWLPGAETVTLPERLRSVASSLATMPTLRRPRGHDALQPLLDMGILAPQDLPLRIVPEDPAALDGWRFA